MKNEKKGGRGRKAGKKKGQTVSEERTKVERRGREEA